MICHLHARAITTKEKKVVLFTSEQNIICSQTELDNIKHEKIVLCMQFLQVT